MLESRVRSNPAADRSKGAGGPPKKMWPLSVVVLPAHNMVLMGCADRLLQIYDCTNHELIRCAMATCCHADVVTMS